MTTGSLAGASALVTGGSRGIGLAIARALQGAGARVLICARDPERLRASGFEHLVIDITDPAAVELLAGQAERSLGQLPDIAVHSAGAFALAPIARTSVESFDRQLNTNLRAAFLLMRGLLPGMLARKSGHLVSIGSIAGRQAFPDNGAYSASKFGLRGLHAVLAAELRGSGVRATLIEPAATDTELWDAVDRETLTQLPAPAAMLPASAVAQAVLYAVSQPAGVTVGNLSVERS